jgi:hypothetical protein
MATIITTDHRAFPFKAAQIRNPSAKLMLVEEDDKTINDPRWIPVSNFVSPRHRGKGCVAFADTHMELVKPSFGQNPTNSNPTF